MKSWEDGNQMYRQEPAPPKFPKFQNYIELYLAEQDEKYLAWCFHYYERVLNIKAREFVTEFAMEGHFADLKQAYVEGMLEALASYDVTTGTPFLIYKKHYAMHTVYTYIRTMRSGYTSGTSYEGSQLSAVMRAYSAHGYSTDENTIIVISEETGISRKIVQEILEGALRNRNRVDLYCQYTDEDEEETLEIGFADERTQTEQLFFAIERAERVMNAFESLNSRERAMVSDHLGFCRDCYGTYCVYSHGALKKRKAISFADLATRHGLSSPDTAFRIYHGALEKMRKKLMEEGITHI